MSKQTKPHLTLKDKHVGQDIYVLGSGMSMNFLSPNFFEGKISIGTNSIW